MTWQLVGRLPTAKDGRDAVVDSEMVRSEVARAVAALPPAKEGPKGKDGAEGLTIKGDKGDKGEVGEGRDGRDGEPGRDAVHLDVIDGIDPAKRYQRGTFATYRGGLIRSFKATDPMAPGADLERSGWHVVVQGLADIALDLGDDLRTVQVKMIYTGGDVVSKAMTLPVVIYRDIWREENTYTKGDSVTRGGSTWVLMADHQTGKPGDENSGWKMAVKSTNGRDGLKGEKGDRGAEGRAGKDLTSMSLAGEKYR